MAMTPDSAWSPRMTYVMWNRGPSADKPPVTVRQGGGQAADELAAVDQEPVGEHERVTESLVRNGLGQGLSDTEAVGGLPDLRVRGLNRRPLELNRRRHDRVVADLR